MEFLYDKICGEITYWRTILPPDLNASLKHRNPQGIALAGFLLSITCQINVFECLGLSAPI